MKGPECEKKKEEGNPPGNTPLTNEVLLVHLPIPPPPPWLSRMRARFPGVEVRWREAEVLPNSSLTTLDELPDADLEGVTMACLYPEPADAGRTMRDVRFVQLASAGSDRWAGHPVFGDRRVRFCSASGVHAPQIGEWIIGTWLSFQHNLTQYALNQREQLWSPRTTDFGTDSVGQRMGILGYGAIGRHAARLARALGMEIYVHGRSPRPTPESRRLDPGGFSVQGTGDPEGELPSAWFSGAGGLDELLASDLDLLVVCVPLTKDTRHLLSRREFAILEQRRRGRGGKGTFVCNVARGAVVDTDALVKALASGQIAGAALDVTDPEPLPRGHPLWEAPNLFLSPHVAYQSTSVFPRVAEVLFGNLERLEAGEPLVNEIFRG